MDSVFFEIKPKNIKLMEILKYWWVLPVVIIAAMFLYFVIDDLFRDYEEDDTLWKKEAADEGFTLPAKKSFFLLRLPGIRRIRWMWNECRTDQHRALHGALCLQPRDRLILWAIYRGWY